MKIDDCYLSPNGALACWPKYLLFMKSIWACLAKLIRGETSAGSPMFRDGRCKLMLLPPLMLRVNVSSNLLPFWEVRTFSAIGPRLYWNY